MFQRCFDNKKEALFAQGMTPKLSRFVISDDPNWESGHHVHNDESELIYVKQGVARLVIDSSSTWHTLVISWLLSLADSMR